MAYNGGARIYTGLVQLDMQQIEELTMNELKIQRVTGVSLSLLSVVVIGLSAYYFLLFRIKCE